MGGGEGEGGCWREGGAWGHAEAKGGGIFFFFFFFFPIVAFPRVQVISGSRD